MRCLPVADDCGITCGATETIFRCMDAGRLLGTSVVAGGAYAEEAGVALGMRLAANAELRAGVHLNVLEGVCSAHPSDVPLLAHKNGQFKHSLMSLWRALTLNAPRMKEALREQVEHEFRAQISAVLQSIGKGFVAGQKEKFQQQDMPIYFDGHLHVHALPALLPVLEKLVREYSVKHVRVPSEIRYMLPSSPLLCLTGVLRRELLAFWSGPLRSMLERNEVQCPDFFIGAFCSGSMTLPRLQAGLAAVQKKATENSLVEIMFHPGGFSIEEQACYCSAPSASLSSSPAGPEVSKTCAPTFTDFYSSSCRATEEAVLLSDDFKRLMQHYNK